MEMWSCLFSIQASNTPAFVGGELLHGSVTAPPVSAPELSKNYHILFSSSQQFYDTICHCILEFYEHSETKAIFQ